MPRKTPINSFQWAGFTGGLNTDADPYQLEPTESPDCLNVDFGFRGAVSKRMGYTSLTTTQTQTNERIIAWQQAGSSEWLFGIDEDGDIWDYTSTPVEDLATWTGPTGEDDYPIGVASLANFLYVTNLRSGLTAQRFNGGTWTSMPAAGFDGTAGEIPRAKHLISAHDRLFAANVDDDGTRHRSRLHWSEALTPGTWQATDYIDFDPDDGSEITAIATFGEEIVVFKNHSVQLLAGKAPEAFSRFVIDTHLGTVSPYAVTAFGPLLVFFDRDTGVWGFDGSGFELLSEKINDHLLSGINYSLAYKAHAFTYRTKLYVSVPWGSSTVNSRTFVWDQRTKAWTQYDFGVADTALYGQDMYAVGVRDAAGVQKLFSTYNDDGAAISAYVKTPWMSPDGPESRSRIRRLDLAFASLTANVTVDMYRDFNSAAAYRSQVFSLSAGGSTWGSMVWGTDPWGGASEQTLLLTTGWGQRFRAVQFKFSVSATDDQFQLNRVTLHSSSLGRVRGEA